MTSVKLESQIILFAIIFISISSAQIMVPGYCPKVNVTSDFSIDNFLGKWYEVQAYPYFYTIASSCVTWSFDHLENGTMSLMTYHHRFGLDEYTSAKVEIVRPGIILVSYPYSVVPRADSDYYVLATDYDNYAVLYSCSNVLFFRTTNVWILSRKSVLEDDLLEKAKSAIKAEGISTSFLVTTSQTCGASAISK